MVLEFDQYSFQFNCNHVVLILMISPELDEFCKSVRVQPCHLPSINCPWCNGKEYKHFQQSMCIHREILDFTRWIQPTLEENQLRFIVIKKFRNAVKLLWPRASILCHGSSATGTYLPNGDIDFLVINAPKIKSDISLLQELNSHLKSLSMFKSSLVIKSAKCPIIKGTEKPFGFKIDISINNNNGILNVQRNKNLMKKYPQIYPLLFVLKFFLLENNLDQPYQGGISTNTLQQMIIFIIQSTPPAQRMNLGSLLSSFLQTFGVFFNYITTGISTRFGGFLFSRMDVENVNWKNPVNICVEDPQIPGLFLGENAFEINTFRNQCFIAFNQLKKTNQNEQSLLLRFIHGSDIITKSRKSMKELYDSVLHKKLKIERYEDEYKSNDSDNNRSRNRRNRPFFSIDIPKDKDKDKRDKRINIDSDHMDYSFYYHLKDKNKNSDQNKKQSFIAPSYNLSSKNFMSSSTTSNNKNFYSFQKPLLYRR
ncbi:Non-canonical poly(A) RNA polymerase papd5 [Tritrichomonas musculus]|uniref:Non-canonical poly(A) RNA polymerase papd5 n=1 Tax=Tritrichomonas musculus TaxID=1915356 RepID=A0ABR2INI4_9EUKA